MSPQKQAILDVAKQLNIEYVRFSAIAMEVFGSCFVLDDSAFKVPSDDDDEVDKLIVRMKKL